MSDLSTPASASPSAEVEPGPHFPHPGTPARRHGSVRRTTTHTCLRPDGLLGEVHVLAHARDLWTGWDGDSRTLEQTDLDAVIAFIEDRSLRAITVDPPGPHVDPLVGLRVSSGFRKAVDEVMPETDQARSLQYQLLDDLPTAVLVSGVAMASSGMHPPRGMLDLSSRADICAGWATGGTIMVHGESLGHPPIVKGPLAPSLRPSVDDPIAWHQMEELTPHSTRRCRRIDVWRAAESEQGTSLLLVEELFRDTHMDGDGVETVVHEYLVSAEIEPDSLTFVSCRADIGVLPWTECPAAASSAERLIGTTPHDLRERVRQNFVGTSTCTHLNDTLRSFAALPYLASVVVAGGELRT